MMFLGACGGSVAETGLSSTRGATASPGAPSSGSAPSGTLSSAVSCRTAARSVCITRHAEGRTVTVGVGWTVGVDLYAPGTEWSAPSLIGPRLLRRVTGVQHQNGGVEVDYVAVAAGVSTLRATERPACSPGRVCPQYIVLWQVRIHVTGR